MKYDLAIIQSDKLIHIYESFNEPKRLAFCGLQLENDPFFTTDSIEKLKEMLEMNFKQGQNFCQKCVDKHPVKLLFNRN